MSGYRERGIPLRLVQYSFVSNYRELASAKANGAIKARGYAACDRMSGCRVARELVDGKEYYIDDLLAAYDNPLGPVPIIPHPMCGTLNVDSDDGPQDTCACSWAHRPAPRPGVDPKFIAWMEAELEKVKP